MTTPGAVLRARFPHAQLTHEMISKEEIEDKADQFMYYLSEMLEDRIISGVYLLMFNERVVYVGKSMNIMARLQQHRKHGRMFDDWAFMPVPSGDTEEMDYMEAKVIGHMCPEQNRKLLASNDGAGSAHLLTDLEAKSAEDIAAIKKKAHKMLCRSGVAPISAETTADAIIDMVIDWLKEEDYA